MQYIHAPVVTSNPCGLTLAALNLGTCTLTDTLLMCMPRYTVNFACNDIRPGIEKVSLFAKCRYTRSLIIMYYSWKGLCSGHGNAVVIHELSLYPQSLLAKLTVVPMFTSCCSSSFAAGA